MKITITQNHINNGRRSESSRCPLALALHDAGFENAHVGDSDIVFWRPSPTPSIHVDLPRAVKNWVRDFDHSDMTGDRMQPICFDLDIPAEAK